MWVTIDSRHSLPIALNRLDQQFLVGMPNRIWVVVDLFSRRIVGWSLRSETKAETVTTALGMAWYRRSPAQFEERWQGGTATTTMIL